MINDYDEILCRSKLQFQLCRNAYSIHIPFLSMLVLKIVFSVGEDVRQGSWQEELLVPWNQGWEFALLLKISLLKERPWAICSLQKSDESELLFNKDWHEWFTRFLRANHTFTLLLSINDWFAQKNLLISPCFWQFFTTFLIFMPKSKSLTTLFALLLFAPSLCAPKLKVTTMSNLLLSLFTKEQQKQCTLGKKQIAILLFCSFAHKKWAIHLKNQRANSQPCLGPAQEIGMIGSKGGLLLHNWTCGVQPSGISKHESWL